MDYVVFANLAESMLTEFGASATLVHKAAGAYDPSTSTSVPAESTETIRAVAFPYDAKLVDGTMVQVDDVQVFMSPVGVAAPQAGDKLTLNGGVYTVIKTKNYSPTGTPVLYELQVRK